MATSRHIAGSLLAVAVLVATVGLLALYGERAAPPDEPRQDAPPAAERRPQSNASDPTSPAPVPDTPLWEAVPETAVNPLPEYAAQWSHAGRALVRTSGAMAAAGGWRVGDRLILPLPQLNAVYRPLIEEIDDGPGPSRSALGKVTGDDGRRRRFVVTVGPAHVFAYIDTPEGPYELTGGDRFGWLLPTSSMMAGFDFSEPDYILPEEWDRRDAP